MTSLFVESIGDFDRLLQMGETPESSTLDFKRDLDRWRDPSGDGRRDGQREFCRDLSAFANTWGGCLLFGVDEEVKGAMRVASGVHPLDDFDKRRQWMEQAVQNYLVPSTLTYRIVPIQHPRGLVIAVNVLPSRHLVSLYDKHAHTIECLRRTNHGKDWMNPDEVERQRMDGSRSAKIGLDRAKREVGDQRPVHLATGVWRSVPVIEGGIAASSARSRIVLQRMNWPVFLGGVTEFEVELRVSVPEASGLTCVNIPFGIVEDVWVTSDRCIGVFLRARIVVHGPGSTVLEPF